MELIREPAITTLKELLRFKSVLSEEMPNMPFGQGIYDALQYILKKGEELGFTATNYDNYIGQLDFGDSEDAIAVLCHLDVVPEGNNWTKSAFEPVIENGKLYGRGTMDDKGPLVAVLYAMKELKDDGFIPKKRICLIIGCDEETAWRDIDYYKAHAVMPDIGFSPDADFPVINCERGILHFKIIFDMEGNLPFKNVCGGTRCNVVPDLASFELNVKEQEAKQIALANNFEYEKIKSGYRFSARGKSAHGSKPFLGDNAIWKIFNAIYKLNQDSEALEFIANELCCSDSKEKLNIAFSDNMSGALTMNVGVVSVEGDKLIFEVDIRYPISVSAEQILESINYILPYNANAKLVKNQLPLYVKQDNLLVLKLLKAYRDVTGDRTAKPKIIGGGTFARALKTGVAFGPYFDSDEDVLHQADEYISITRFNMLIDIYKKALLSLCE